LALDLGPELQDVAEARNIDCRILRESRRWVRRDGEGLHSHIDRDAGAMTALLGANGAGKTTTLRAITGTLRPYAGRVVFAGEDVTRLPAHVKAARGLILVPEE